MDIRDKVFDNLLFRLEPNLPDSAARYKLFRSKMVKFFEWKHCEDADGLADETITRTLNHLSAGKEILAENPYIYIYGIAKNVYREYVRKQIRKEGLVRKLKELPGLAEEEAQDCRAHCLEKLPPDKLELLKRYYLYPEDRETLAAELGMTLNALRLQVHRLKKELKECQEDCLRKIL